MSLPQTSSVSELSSRSRWWVVALLSASIAINLVDRQVLSVVAPVLREQLHLSNTQYSYIILAFQIGMLLGQVPVGTFMDAIGTRVAMSVIFVGWSVANGLHALARGLSAFMGLRFAMGLTECGNYTGGIKAIAGLFPAERRALAGGIFNAGAQLGSVIAPPLIVLITVKWGWQMSFLLPSLLGLIWVVPWLWSFQRTPGPGSHRTALVHVASSPLASCCGIHKCGACFCCESSLDH